MFKEPSGYTPANNSQKDENIPQDWNDFFENYRDKKINKPNERDFLSVYSQEEIERDLICLKKLKEKDHDGTVAGKVFENLFFDKAGVIGWFGENSAIIPMTDYDDRISRGDAVWEFRDENNDIIRILIDVTTSSNEETLLDKFKKGVSGIDKLAEVKYFQSSLVDFKGKITHIPLVTVGISFESLQKLCMDFSVSDDQKNNIVQHIFLDETINHLMYMVGESEIINGVNSNITKKLQKILKAVDNISIQKENLRTESVEAEISEDKTYSILLSLSS